MKFKHTEVVDTRLLGLELNGQGSLMTLRVLVLSGHEGCRGDDDIQHQYGIVWRWKRSWKLS